MIDTSNYSVSVSESQSQSFCGASSIPSMYKLQKVIRQNKFNGYENYTRRAK